MVWRGIRQRARAFQLCRLLLVVAVWPGQAAQAAGQATQAGQTALACDASAVTASWPRIHVVVTGIRKVAGNVTLTLYGEQPAAFLAHKGSIAIVRVPVTGPAAQACLAVSSPGLYALAVYHDENDNHHFDRTMLGLPAEDYGFSNDAPTLFGPPSFKAARFTVAAGGAQIAIRLRS